MQNRLANVLLGNTELQQQLNYNGTSGSLNYFAVAHVGILVFADWIFNTYIKSVPALYKTWQWIMGVVPGFSSSDTLVDVVNKIWNAGSDAITAIKNAATKFVDGVKAAGQFILKAILNTMLNMIVLIIQSFLNVMYQMLKIIFPNTITYSNNILSIYGFKIGISRTTNGINLIIGNMSLEIDNLFSNSQFNMQTLSVTGLVLGSTAGLIVTSILVPVLAKTYPTWAVVAIIASLVFQTLLFKSFVSSGKISPQDKNDLEIYYGINAALSACSALLAFWQIDGTTNPSNPVFQKVLPFFYSVYKTKEEVGLVAWVGAVVGAFGYATMGVASFI